MLGLEESVRFGVITHLVGNHLSLVGRSAWVKGFFCEQKRGNEGSGKEGVVFCEGVTILQDSKIGNSQR